MSQSSTTDGGVDFLTPTLPSSTSSSSSAAPTSHASDSPFYQLASAELTHNSASTLPTTTINEPVEPVLDVASPNTPFSPNSSSIDQLTDMMKDQSFGQLVDSQQLNQLSGGGESFSHPASASSSFNDKTTAIGTAEPASEFDFSNFTTGNNTHGSNMDSTSSPTLTTNSLTSSGSGTAIAELDLITATADAFRSTAHGGISPEEILTIHQTTVAAVASSTTKKSATTAASEEPSLNEPTSSTTSAQNTSFTLSSASNSTPNSPQVPTTTSTKNNNSGSKGTKPVASPSINPISSSSAPPAITRLSVSGSTENLFANVASEASPTAVLLPTSGTTTTKPAASSSRGGIFTRLFNPFGSTSSNNPSSTNPPPPVSSPNPVNAKDGQSAPTTPSLLVTPTHATSVSSTTANNNNPLPTNPAPAPVIIPKSYTYPDFAAKMKLPGARDLVKTLKDYVKLVQAPEWFAKHSAHPDVVAKSATEYDRIKLEYNDMITQIMKTIRHKHPLWKGCSEEEIDNSLESIEKFLSSKLYEKFFGLFPADRLRDTQLTERLFILNTWVQPHHLDLPPSCCTDVSIWDPPAEELRNMDKFKSPRDKLVCLLNCCHIINSLQPLAHLSDRSMYILKRAKVKANAEKAEQLESKRKLRLAEKAERAERERAEKEKADASENASTESVPSADSLAVKRNSIDDGFTPSASPSADDFFPALIYTLIHSRPPHLYLNLTYISLCRYESKLNGGEAAYWYTNLASAIQFLESISEKSFSFGKERNPTTSKKEYERLMEEGQLKWKTFQETETAAAAEEAKKKEEEAATAAAAATDAKSTATTDPADNSLPPPLEPVSTASSNVSSSNSSSFSSNAQPLIHNHGSSSWTVTSSSGSASINVAPTPLPPPCIACLQLSHRRVPTHFLDREFGSLTVNELQDVLREYKELCFVLQGWQETAMHREMKSMPLPPKHSHAAYASDDGDGVALTGADANSAAPSNAHVAASSTATNQNQSTGTSASSLTTPISTGSARSAWPLGGFLSLGRSGK